MTAERQEDSYPYQIERRAEKDGISPQEYVGREIRVAITRGNPLLRKEDQIVVMGIDAWDGHFYPCGSYSSLEEASERVGELDREEYRYAEHSVDRDGWESTSPVNTFYIFTTDGLPALPQSEPPQP